MIEQFHQLDQSQFRVLTIHVIDLSAKSLSKGVAAKIAYLHPVLLLHLFKDDVDSLNGEDSPFLTYQDWGVDSYRLDVFVAFFYMLL